ncbi:hypothetical protein, partial [Helicobacter bilis]
DGTTDWALHGKYDTGSQVNSREQYEKGIHAGTSLDLLGNREMLDKQIAQNAEKNKDSLENYTKALAEFEKPNYFDETMKEFDKAWDKANMNTDTLRAMALFAKAYTWDSAADSLEGIYDWATTRFGDNKTETKLRDINLLDQKNNASMQVVGRGAEADELVRMFRITEGQLAVSEEAFKIYRHETKEALLDYIKADSKDKDKKWETYQKSLSKVKEAYDKSPAKAFANNELISKAMTMKNQHDYGRFVFNLLKEPEKNMELAQSYINDLEYILKTDDNFKDVDEVALTRSGQVVIRKGDQYQALEQGFLESILHGIHDSAAEITSSLGGAWWGLKKPSKNYLQTAAKAGVYSSAGAAVGAAAGAIADEEINSWTTGYKNKDGGLKRAAEAATLSIAGDIIIVGAGAGIKQGYKAIKNTNLDGLSNIGNKAISEAQKLANGNVNAVTNFLAKNALDNNEREAIKEAAQKEFLNGKSLADYKSDSSIPKLERLKNAWQYEKFINKESMAKGKDKLEALSKEFESFQTTSMESNRPIMSLMQDMFEGKATRHEREKFLRFVSQNEALQSALSGVLAKNPTLALNFGQFIDKRAAQVAKSIESEALTQRMFKDMDSSYAKGLKDRYGKVEYDIKRTLDNINFSSTGTKIADILMDLKESIPHVTNAGQTINAMLQKLQARGIKSFDDDMLEFIEPNLNIDDLLNIRKYYNDILRSKDFKNASFKHLQAINNEIDSVVENALQDIAQQSGINTGKLLKNYKDI